VHTLSSRFYHRANTTSTNGNCGNCALPQVRDAACRDWTVPLERALVPFVLERSAASQKQLDDLVDAIKAQQRRQEGAGATSCELKV
jgi:hypothetical protein